jgi:hypothetical protein
MKNLFLDGPSPSLKWTPAPALGVQGDASTRCYKIAAPVARRRVLAFLIVITLGVFSYVFRPSWAIYSVWVSALFAAGASGVSGLWSG